MTRADRSGGSGWVEAVPDIPRHGKGVHMTAHADDMVLVPRAELDALRAESRRLRREVRDREALKRIRPGPGKAAPSPARNSPRRGESVSDRVLRSPGRTWDELEALPQPLRNTAHRVIFHLPDEPGPLLAEPFPKQARSPTPTVSMSCSTGPCHKPGSLRLCLRAAAGGSSNTPPHSRAP